MVAPMIAGWLAWPAAWLLGYMLHMAGVLSSVPHAFVEHIGFPFTMLLSAYAVVGVIILILRW